MTQKYLINSPKTDVSTLNGAGLSHLSEGFNFNKMKLIPLTRGKFAQVDDEDYEYLMQFKWQCHRGHNTQYATGALYSKETKKQTYVAMHRLLLGLTNPKVHTDHIDRNGLNNQRSNLRVATPSQNCANVKKVNGKSSRYLGVRFRKDNLKWCAEIRKNSKGYRLGCFKTEKEAALAYNKAAKELHGEFANLNIIEE